MHGKIQCYSLQTYHALSVISLLAPNKLHYRKVPLYFCPVAPTHQIDTSFFNANKVINSWNYTISGSITSGLNGIKDGYF